MVVDATSMSFIHRDSIYPKASPYLTISKVPLYLPEEPNFLDTESGSFLPLCLEESPPQNMPQQIFAPTKEEMKE